MIFETKFLGFLEIFMEWFLNVIEVYRNFVNFCTISIYFKGFYSILFQFV